MTDGAYYNERDPKAAAWIRELIKAGHVAPGEVDERTIVDVQPDDLRGFTQCHFFAGIAVWSYAMRCAGWLDDRPVWTGSCPCQPFSAAGKGDEFADERHLWPAWFRLIRECRPIAVFGEQVASKDALAWFDHVSTDLEGEGYAVGAVDTCAAGFGAPHIRQRLYFVAQSNNAERRTDAAGRNERNGKNSGWPKGAGDVEGCSAISGLAHPNQDGRPTNVGGGIQHGEYHVESCSVMGNAIRQGLQEQRGGGRVPRSPPQSSEGQTFERASAPVGPVEYAEIDGCEGQPIRGNGDPEDRVAQAGIPGATNGFWADAEWISCRDGKARPTEPGTFPLADGATARVVKLRGYGNAICAPQAEEFIRAFIATNPGAER